MPCFGAQGPLSLVWRALTLGLWPLPEAAPFFAVLLEDYTLYILLAYFLSSAPLFCGRLELSMDLMHSQLREPPWLQVFAFDIFRLPWRCVSILAYQQGGRMRVSGLISGLLWCSVSLWNLIFCPLKTIHFWFDSSCHFLTKPWSSFNILIITVEASYATNILEFNDIVIIVGWRYKNMPGHQDIKNIVC